MKEKKTRASGKESDEDNDCGQNDGEKSRG